MGSSILDKIDGPLRAYLRPLRYLFYFPCYFILEKARFFLSIQQIYQFTSSNLLLDPLKTVLFSPPFVILRLFHRDGSALERELRINFVDSIFIHRPTCSSSNDFNEETMILRNTDDIRTNDGYIPPLFEQLPPMSRHCSFVPDTESIFRLKLFGIKEVAFVRKFRKLDNKVFSFT